MGRLIVLLALSLTGGVSQVKPIHLPDQVRFEPALIGTWREVEGSSNTGQTFEVRRSSGDEKSYHVTVRSGPGPEVTTEFRATLAEIDGQHYLTVVDVKEAPKGTCSTVVVDGWACKIKVRLLKPGWLHQAVRVNPPLGNASAVPFEHQFQAICISFQFGILPKTMTCERRIWLDDVGYDNS